MFKSLTKLAVTFLIVSLSSCASIKEGAKTDKPNFPAMTAKTVKLKEGFAIKDTFVPPIGTIKGNVWDMQNGTLELTGGKCNNDEKGEKVVIWKNDLFVKNGKFSHWEDGVNIRASNVTFQNVVFENCEDALNMGEGCADFTIYKCYFAPHSKKESSEKYQADKLIQAAITKGNNSITESIFWNSMCSIRIGLNKYSGSKYEGVTEIKNNTFSMASTAIHRVKGEVKISDNKYNAVAEKYKNEE
jgi:hypothetical protein